jgi:DnaJ-class molecular chaperone
MLKSLRGSPMCHAFNYRAYRRLALKHHPDKALQHCRWGRALGPSGANSPAAGIESCLKTAANEVFNYISSAHEELSDESARRKVSCY